MPFGFDCRGSNDHGQLGLGDSITRGGKADTMGDALPAVSLGDGLKAVSIAIGDIHSCALLEDMEGTKVVKCW